jgi:hypothetical protein
VAKKYFLLTISALLLTAQLAIAAEKHVKCEIFSNQKMLFKGPCLFLAEHHGTFSLSNSDKSKPLFDNISLLTVAMVKKNLAEVRGLTTEGINSRWGNAKRSLKDRACWVGGDFKICAK